MQVLWAIFVWAVFGLIVGGAARLVVPGRQPIGIGMTILLGIAGSFAGGVVGWLIRGGSPLQASGLILSFVGATVILAIYVRTARHKHSS